MFDLFLGMADESFAVAQYDYHSQNDEELTIKKNDRLLILNDSGAWWLVQNERQQSGLVPSNYLQRTDKGLRSIVQKIFSRKGSSSGLAEAEPPGYAAPEQLVNRNNQQGKMDEAIAKYKYTPVREDEIALEKGDRVYVLEKEGDGWWKGKVKHKTGWFPSNYVEIINPDNQADNVICKVRTLYAFTPANTEELSFEKDTLLEIIDQPKDDPEWWKARKKDGTVGLVPKNYVKIVKEDTSTNEIPHPSSSTPVAVVDNNILTQEWYHGNISRQECETKLHVSRDGDFLVRASETKVVTLYPLRSRVMLAWLHNFIGSSTIEY